MGGAGGLGGQGQGANPLSKKDMPKTAEEKLDPERCPYRALLGCLSYILLGASRHLYSYLNSSSFPGQSREAALGGIETCRCLFKTQIIVFGINKMLQNIIL